MTRVLRVDPDAPEPARIAEAAAEIRRGGLVAFPTETVYGLGANALDAAAVRAIYAAKGRPSFNPVICHVGSVDEARALAARWPAAADALAAAFWPGPLTVVVPRRLHVPDVVTAGREGVAIRVPSHPVARALIAAAGLPIAAPSANRSNEVSPTQAAHVLASLGDRVPVVLDGGPATVGLESAVVDLTERTPRLLRPGTIGRDRLEAVTGPLADAARVEGTAARAAPGLLDRHYAPRATLLLVPSIGSTETAQLAERLRAHGKVGALTPGPAPRWADVTRLVPADPGGQARELYAALHELDAARCASIIAERPPSGVEWAAVRDRLTRAAHAAE